VVGFSVSQASSTLAAAGLQKSLVFAPTSQKGNDGKVLAQDRRPARWSTRRPRWC